MSDTGDATLGILQDGFATIHENSNRMLALTEALLAKLQDDRAESDRRFHKQARKLRVQSWATAFVIALLALVIIQNAQEADRREERAAVSEAQRKCLATIQNATLARLAMLATATPNRVNGSGSSVDPVAMGQLRSDLAATNATTPPDPAALLRVRDDVAAILASISPDSPESRQLREEVAQANDALLRSNMICFTDNPPANPLGG